MQDNKTNIMKILIIDDDNSVRDFLVLFFKKKGYDNVLSADSAKSGLELLDKEKPELVLLDIKLPDADGMDVLRSIKERDKATGVIMITGYPDEEKARNMMDSGAYDYIVKPFDLAYLELSVLSKIVKLSK